LGNKPITLHFGFPTLPFNPALHSAHFVGPDRCPCPELAASNSEKLRNNLELLRLTEQTKFFLEKAHELGKLRKLTNPLYQPLHALR
jgi:hypothetical protein